MVPARGRAIVYNNHLAQLGGGERSCLAFAKALGEIGYRPEVVVVGPMPSRQTLVAHFGEEFSSIPVQRVPLRDFSAFVRSPDVAIFVNHTYLSFLANPAPIGIYAQMFPAMELNDDSHGALDTLRTYQLMLCNSEFTRKYTRRRWGVAEPCLDVLRPPIGESAVAAGRAFLRQLPRKIKQFVHVGRFGPQQNAKNQHVIIEAFLDAGSRHAELLDWRLVLIGTCGEESTAREYYDSCCALAARSGGRVEIRTNVRESELSAVLTESFGYVHATGAFLPPGVEPERCEHFGLSIVEAMAHACLSLAYARGGIWEIAAGNAGVRAYVTPEQLVDGFRALAGHFGCAEGAELQRRSVEQALALDFESFTNRLRSLLQSSIARTSPGLAVPRL